MMPGDDVLTETVARRIEVFTGVGRRRKWSSEAKAEDGRFRWPRIEDGVIRLTAA
jgi:hypothetical protein